MARRATQVTVEVVANDLKRRVTQVTLEVVDGPVYSKPKVGVIWFHPPKQEAVKP